MFFTGAGTLKNYFHINPKVENKAQVFVLIMQGCDKFCTYCVVPYTRGRELSRPLADVLKECEQRVDNGAIEITLLGQNVNSTTKGCTLTQDEVANFLKYFLSQAGYSKAKKSTSMFLNEKGMY